MQGEPILKPLAENEVEMVKYILKMYGMKVLNVEKVRSVYKIQTEQKLVCLKKMKNGTRKVNNAYILVEELIKNNFNKTARYFKTKDNENFISYEGFIFCAMEWIDGRECDMKKIDEAVNSAKLLAQFHKATEHVNKNNLCIGNNIKDWNKIYLKRLEDLKVYRQLINVKRNKKEFDIVYESYIDNFYEQGFLAVKFLDKSSYCEIIKNAGKNKTICHDSFYYQNIIKKDNEYFIIDLNSIVINLQIYDLGKMINRLLYNKKYKWDFSMAKLLIEAYNTVNKLTKEELEIMLSLIIYPQKFWKLGRKRYFKNKCWQETKYMRKLNKIIKYKDRQEKFINDYIMYLDGYN